MQTCMRHVHLDTASFYRVLIRKLLFIAPVLKSAEYALYISSSLFAQSVMKASYKDESGVVRTSKHSCGFTEEILSNKGGGPPPFPL